MFKPLNDRVLIEPIEVQEQTSFGLVLAEAAKERPATGIVVVGSKTIKKGVKVAFSKYGYDEIELDKKTYYVVSETNILGIF